MDNQIYTHFYYENTYLFTVTGKELAQSVCNRLCREANAMGYSWSDSGKVYLSNVPVAPASDLASADKSVTAMKPFTEALYQEHVAHLKYLYALADNSLYMGCGNARRHAMYQMTLPSARLKVAPQYPWANREQLDEIIAGIQEGLAPELRTLYAKPEYTARQMNSIRYALTSGLPLEDVVVLADPAFDPVQMDVIKAGFEAGMTYEQVRDFAKPGIPAQQMLDAVWAFQGGHPWPPECAEAVSPELDPEAEMDLEH